MRTKAMKLRTQAWCLPDAREQNLDAPAARTTHSPFGDAQSPDKAKKKDHAHHSGLPYLQGSKCVTVVHPICTITKAQLDLRISIQPKTANESTQQSS